MSRYGKNVIRRGDSANLYLQLRVPKELLPYIGPNGRKKVVVSLHTSDPEEADRRAAYPIAIWKQNLGALKSALNGTMKSSMAPVMKQKPGTRVDNPDGTYYLANEKHIMHMAPDGLMPLDVQPNVEIGQALALSFPIEGVDHSGQFFVEPGRIEQLLKPGALPDWGMAKSLKPELARDLDAEIIENWAFKNGVGDRFKADALATLKVFRDVCPGKTFATADYDDGSALAEALYAKGNKHATVRKKVAFLRAAVNIAKRSPKRFPGILNKDNPFSAVVRKVDDATDKVMLDDADVALMRSRWHELGSNERTLLIWCLALGCRRGEPFQVRSERVIDGYRTIRFGSKSVASDRTLPLPPVLLQLHPEPITGPLFTDSEITIGKRINLWMRKIGITDPGKTLHSTRHRASYKLRRFEDSVRWECLGHENRNDPSETYGCYPQKELFEALSAIGI